jgi:hypothetical protein
MQHPDLSTSRTLALRSRGAALTLGISGRTLWQWTNDGIVPHVRVRGVILYPVEGLRDWLRAQTAPEKGGLQL